MRFYTVALTAIFTALCYASASAADPPAAVPSAEAVDKHIEKRIKDLWRSVNATGDWDLGEYQGHQTAINLLGLREAGVDVSDPRFKKALDYLQHCPDRELRTRAWRAALHSRLGRDYAALAKKDVEAILEHAHEPTGFFLSSRVLPRHSYAGDIASYRNMQMAAWAFHEASAVGVEMPAKVWQFVEKAYLSGQLPDGGWPSMKRGRQAESWETMNGILSLAYIMDRLYLRSPADCRKTPAPQLLQAMGKGYRYVELNCMPPRDEKARKAYRPFSIELQIIGRIGTEFGLKYIGDCNWYPEVASIILSQQMKSYKQKSEPGFELIALSESRAPVLFNKLIWDATSAGRPFDLARLCQWLSRQNEGRRFNWQQTRPDRLASDIFDAPILIIAGDSGFKLDADACIRLKDWLQRGGVLLAVPASAGEAFDRAVSDLCARLDPINLPQLLPPDHVLYKGLDKLGGAKVALKALQSDGRVQVLIAQRDLSCDWQRMDERGTAASMQLMVNLTDYVKPEKGWPTRETTYDAIWPKLGKPQPEPAKAPVGSGESSEEIEDLAGGGRGG